MKSILVGAVAAVLIAILSAVVLSGFDMDSGSVYSTSNVRL